MTNTGANGLNINGTVQNKGTAKVTNKAGMLNVAGTFENDGDATFTNDGTELNVSGTITNKTGLLKMTNNGDDGFNITETGNVNAQGLEMLNSGANGLNINGKVQNKGTVQNNGTATVTNKAGKLNVAGTFENDGDATFTNDGTELNISGSISNKNGLLKMTNNGANGFNITSTGTVANTGNSELYNYGEGGLNIDGAIDNGGDLYMKNTGAKGFNVNGTVVNGGTLAMDNSGEKGLNVSGSVTSTGDITMTNSGEKGVNIASKGRVTGKANTTINNTATGGVNVLGLVNSDQNVNINSTNGNVEIGDETENNNYVTAGKDINITVTDGSILNYGVEKTLLNATGNLNMDVTDGTIGLEVQQNACTGSGCTGIGPKADGSRDFTKSINANVKGKVNAKTTNTKAATKPDDLVINYAAIDSDMNIDTIKADGRVILTVDDDFGVDNNGTRYNMLNVSKDNTTTNVEGWGISLISNGSIGTSENAVTFIQTGAENGYSMDALANENINLKENSFNDANYGRDKEVKTNKVCTMIAREGDLNVEFAGNTTIENITAEGDMTVITRGKSLEINNIGHIEDTSVTPEDYFGPRHDGYEFDGGYDQDYHKTEVLPNNVTLKALDINHNVRPTDEIVDGHEAWANSTVKVNNAVLDKGKMDITADEVYANGIHVNFGKDGYTKEVDNSTNKVVGASEIPTGHAVRPDDVEGVGRTETERNYYYHEGDGDGTFDGVDSNVDDDDNIVDATPLEMPDEITPPPKDPITPPPPEDPDTPPTDKPNTDETSTYSADTSVAFIQRKVDDNDMDSIDKRQYMRFNVSDNARPVTLEVTNNGISSLVDISRGGIAVTHNNNLNVGDIIPVHLTYADLDINADVKVVSATDKRAGAMFINLDQATANKLLYLNILLEDTNNISFNK
jgi:hypothetical protein